MLSSRKVWLGLLAAVAALASMTASAQNFPTLQGDNQRTGKNSDPFTYGPGIANLVWFWPNGASRPATILRDNMANNPTGTITFRNPGVGSWTVPARDEEAGFFFTATRTGNLAVDERTGAVGRDPFRGFGPAASYELAPSTASAVGSHDDPTTAANAAERKIFTWRIDPTQELPPASTAPSTNYQLYVWLPNGPTGPVVSLGGTTFFPNRYYVYEIIYGNGKRWIDVVDTNFGGQGWIRLGNGGRPTDMTFPYVSGVPIEIRLYNTQWRDEFNTILEDTSVPRAVYADAVMAVPDNGFVTATPVVSEITTTTGTRQQVISVFNKRSSVIIDGRQNAVTMPEVSAFFHNGLGPNLNKPIWTWTPLEVTPYTNPQDNPDATWNPATWTTENLATVNHGGVDYLTATITNTVGASEQVTYAPTLEDGDYVIQVYCPGNSGAEVFGTQTNVFIFEGSNPPVQIPVDQSVAGWVTLGNVRYQHRGSIGENLRVGISNYSPFAADAGKKAFADQVRFIGGFNTEVDSTPVQTKANIRLNNGTTVLKDVVVVASDDGHIYCLDAEGKGDGTTTLYWAYPSIPQANPPANWDPNQVAGLDGVGGIAEMPTSGFGLSSPIVEGDVCYIAAKNGRIYSIDMTGRGDYTTQKVGTTQRNWTFPDDYPAPIKQPAIEGGFGGSLTFATTTQGPTLFAPTMQGRLYAISATGGVNRTTPTRWTFPAMNVPTLGAITTTPTVNFNKLYFGTARLNDTVPGQFYALNVNNGNFLWRFEGDPLVAEADNFMGGPATASTVELGGGVNPNMVFCANDNLYVYGLNADTGALLWQTRELNSPVKQHLMFTWMSVPDQTGTSVPSPVVVVPTDDGRFTWMFARAGDVNIDTTTTDIFRFAGGYFSGSDRLVASMSNGWAFMYGADMSGNLFAFGAAGAVGGMGSPPGGSGAIQGSNSPIAQKFRDAKIMLITRQAYQFLRESDPADVNGDVGTRTYASIVNNAAMRRPTDAFEWGETAYILVYDFPFLNSDPDGNPITPPVVQFQIGVEGASVRTYGVGAKQWKPPFPADKDGYAILAFPIQGSGPTSIPPGNATIKFTFSSSASNTAGRVDNISTSVSRTFSIANPLGLIMPDPTNGAMGIGARAYAISPDPANVDRKVNGSRTSPLLAQSEGVVGNGQTGVGQFWVVDMSMLTLLKGPNRGLEQVRLTRSDLAWQGGGGAVFKPITSADYIGFEDYPINFPNTSLDYPNIGREVIRGTKDPNGTPENAIVSTTGVSLFPPAPYNENNILTRGLHPVLFQLDVDVPRFQPVNNDVSRYFTEAGGLAIPSGYLGRLNIYVDSNGNSILDNVSGRREAYRAFTTTIAVPVDERLSVTTPTVDLGNLAEGTGYAPSQPGLPGFGNALSPWLTGSAVFPAGTITTTNQGYADLFKPFKVANEGNANMLNVRLFKAIVGGPAPGPWPIYSNTVDDLGWLDANQYVWTNFDWNFGLVPWILLQKARVGDRFPTELSLNPTRRFNPNIGVVESLLFPGGPDGDAALPRIAVTPPIGTPFGAYSQNMVIGEDLAPFNVVRPGDQSLLLDPNNNALEIMSTPSLNLKFGVREFRGTNSFTNLTAPMIDYPQAALNGQNLSYSNQQPAGMRLPNGNLVVAWTSPQPAFGAQPTVATTNPEYRIYVSTLAGTAPSNGAGLSPLNDLGGFIPAANDRWFRREVQAYPAGPYDNLFQAGTGETINAGTARFGAPALPSLGTIHPLGGAPFTSTLMAFVGQAEKQTTGGRITESRLMVASMSVNGAGAVTLGNPVAMPYDPITVKSRPSIYQVQNNGATIFYGTSGTGEGQIYYTVTDGASFTRPTVFNVGNGFEDVSSPSVQLRRYSGFDGAKPILEITFVGKLRGRPTSEVFFGRSLTASVNGIPDAPGSPLFLKTRLDEVLTPDSETGTYRALGVAWNMGGASAAATKVWQRIGRAGVPVDIEVPGTRTVDRQSGLIRFDTKLGGQCYLDPNLGTVRFGTATPLRNAIISLDYTPRFLRISESNVAGHATPTLLWDNRIAGDVSNTSYWFDIASGGVITNVPSNSTPRPARYFFTYTRAASGAGQAARPYWKTLRPGVQLQRAIVTDAGGNISNFTITGANGPVQIDPASGKVYFQADEEDKTVTINYQGVVDGSNQIAAMSEQLQVKLITERAENVVPIDQAVNESMMNTFLDPFDITPRRPGLIWMVYVSTRAGTPDLYFQTMAPRFTPVPGR